MSRSETVMAVARDMMRRKSELNAMSGYAHNFPAIFKRVPRSRVMRFSQAAKVIEEADEAFTAMLEGDEFAYVVELLDTVHACETALREFPQDFVDECAAEVVAKNAARGYYGTDEEGGAR